MPNRPGVPKRDAGQYKRKPHGKPALGTVVSLVPTPLEPPLDLPEPHVEPLFSTYDQPKPSTAHKDEAAGQRVVDFIGSLRHYAGTRFAGRPFTLLPWEERLVRELFGWLEYEDGPRLYRKCYAEVARKSGKTALGAAIGLYLAYEDHEPGPQVFFAASDKDQANQCYGAARIMAQQSPELGPRSVFYNSTKRILIAEDPGAELRCLSAETKKLYGLNLSGLIFDELMTQPNRVMWDALTTAQGARTQPLILAITTAGWDRNSVAFEHHEYTRQIAEGKHSDPTFLGVVYSASEDADWTAEETWRAANPSLGVTVDLDYYRQKCQEAQAQPTAQNAFRTLLLCQWVGQETRLIPMDQWSEGGGDVDPETLKGRRCFGGLDLSSTTDLSAFVLAFPMDDGSVVTLPFVFAPRDGLRERGLRDKGPYDTWARQGHLITTPGRSIQYQDIKDVILKATADYDLQDVSYDRWGANQLSQELLASGVKMVEMGQGFASMSAPTKEMLKLLADRKLRHGNHPVLRWMAENAGSKTDPAGNIKLDRERSTGRIDGLVATVMALDGVTRRGLERRSVYEDRGFEAL